MTQLPQVPKGVRPIRGDHLSHVDVRRSEREWRRVANATAVATRRLRRRSVELPGAPPYPKLFVVGCGRSGTSWVQRIISSHPAVITSQESHAYDIVSEPVGRRGRTSIEAWTKVVHRH